MIHHSGHGSQYMSIVYNQRLAEHGITASTGTIGDSYDNALAENVNGPSQERTDPCPYVERCCGCGNRDVRVGELVERITAPPEPGLAHAG
ncbi:MULTISPECIES: hypothetical protein [Corynebacterium]|uniref:hypothetical protein n=1 Tax=Corynebacterium TaxID=1716 RepID=UPI00254E7807|nr:MULTISPECIES: hypothetical protein [Corynebacterium]MDK8563131.1 hypothetical protein [Corynebacterium pseudodiphtheriticum]MDK8846927.1 hypothetical protein [Corynebacterium sp. MSK297]